MLRLLYVSEEVHEWLTIAKIKGKKRKLGDVVEDLINRVEKIEACEEDEDHSEYLDRLINEARPHMDKIKNSTDWLNEIRCNE